MNTKCSDPFADRETRRALCRAAFFREGSLRRQSWSTPNGVVPFVIRRPKIGLSAVGGSGEPPPFVRKPPTKTQRIQFAHSLRGSWFEPIPGGAFAHPAEPNAASEAS